MRHILIIILALPLLACDKETEQGYKCDKDKRTGSFKTLINGNLEFDAKTTYLWYIPDEGYTCLVTYTSDPTCLLTAGLLVRLEEKLGVQQLYKSQWPSISGQTFFDEWDDDTIIGGFELHEGEEAWINITALDSMGMEGVFTATYLWKGRGDPNRIRYTSFPDTLRFNNVAFRAERRPGTPVPD